MKKVNFTLFVVLFVVLIAWIGVYVWDYFVNESGPDNPPSSVEVDKTTKLLEQMEQETKIGFSQINNVDFKWIAEEELTIQGKGFSSIGVTNEEYNKVDTFLLAKGFELNSMNIASGAVSGLNGYQKDDMVCIVAGGLSGYKNASDEWTPVDNINDIEVSCGELE